MISSLKWKDRNEERRHETALTAPIDWKELTKYEINNLLQDTSTDKSTKTSRTEDSTSFCVIDESRPIEEDIKQTKWKQVTSEEIRDNQQQTQRIKWKKATN